MKGGNDMQNRFQLFIDNKSNKKTQSIYNQPTQEIHRQNDTSFLSQFQYSPQMMTPSTSTIFSSQSTICNLHYKQPLHQNGSTKNQNIRSIPSSLSCSNQFYSQSGQSLFNSKEITPVKSNQNSNTQIISNKTISMNKTKSIQEDSNFSIDSSNFPYEEYDQSYYNISYSNNSQYYQQNYGNQENFQQSFSSINMKRNTKKRSNDSVSVSGSYKKKRLIKHKDIEENQCSICLDKLKDRCKLPCKHEFCLDCLTEWMQQSSVCPYCRASVPYYMHQGQKYEVQSKEFDVQSEEDLLDYVCYNCDNTRPGDIILICDRCNVNASHIECDPSLDAREPARDEQWYCYQCRGQLQI